MPGVRVWHTWDPQEVGTSDPILPNNTTVTNLELTKQRKEGPAPSTPTPLRAARFCVVDTLPRAVCTRVVRGNGLCPPWARSLLHPLVSASRAEGDTGLSLTGQAGDRFVFSYSLEIGEVRVRNYERQAGR